ncbi:MAG: beta-glucosidase [Nocardioidaceae bacterium]|nr:beta-glucosidase [Nocardioidaceae bacterium]
MEDDVARLLDALTLEEKASLCLGSDFWHTAPVERLGIPAVMVADGPHGLRKEPEHATQGSLVESVPATCFPTASALGSSWDVDLLQEVGVALGRECQAEQVSVLLGPGVNIKRSPLCGRNFEYFSEDPRLSGELATSFVLGVQSQGVGTSLKHFAANNQETDRVRVSADVDERTLREIYFPAFERTVTQARPWTVMCSYNRLNGTHVSQHRWLLTEVLRDEWGYDGVVVSDWGAVHDRVAAVKAGLDLEMPPQLGHSDRALVEAVRSGELDEAVLDRSVARILSLVAKATAAKQADAVADLDAHHALARRAARECAVLLKNDGDLLPLDLRSGQTVAVIGEFARTPRFQGAGSSQVNPTRVDVALEQIREAVPTGVDVRFAAGFRLDGEHGEGEEGEDLRLGEEAVETARGADVVIAFLGLPASAESEGFDRTYMRLPQPQVELLRMISRVNERVVVVLSNGSAVLTSGWDQHAGALLECWLGGQASGGAVADLLLGTANPCGRLAETIPLRLQDNSSYLNFPGDSGHVRYGEGVFVGYRGHDALDQPVSYPFGHGLSYTTFEYGDLAVDVTGRHADGDLRITVRCSITNTGGRPGKEVAQLYVHDVAASVSRPPLELRGFAKLDLAPGETGTATFELEARDLSYWSEAVQDWVLEAGDFELLVGASSRDIRARATTAVEAPRVAAPLGAMSSLEEWLADPSGAEALRGVLGTTDDGRLAGALGNPELRRVVGNFPMSTLAGFANVDLDRDDLQELVARVGGEPSGTV